MCSINRYITLNENQDCQITYCKNCKSFSLTYKSCCASFTIAAFDQFRQLLGALKEGDFHYDLMGQNRAIVKNPNSNIGFCLTAEEVGALTLSINEALTLFEAFYILYN